VFIYIPSAICPGMVSGGLNSYLLSIFYVSDSKAKAPDMEVPSWANIPVGEDSEQDKLVK
jgi:hypothetical protein